LVVVLVVAVFDTAVTSPEAEDVFTGGGGVHQFATSATNSGEGIRVGDTAFFFGSGVGESTRAVSGLISHTITDAAFLHCTPSAANIGVTRSFVDGGAAIDTHCRGGCVVGDFTVNAGLAGEEVSVSCCVLSSIDKSFAAASSATTTKSPNTPIVVLRRSAFGFVAEALTIRSTDVTELIACSPNTKRSRATSGAVGLEAATIVTATSTDSPQTLWNRLARSFFFETLALVDAT
jgi:hypothetical protein